jgi:hypothetical protein
MEIGLIFLHQDRHRPGRACMNSFRWRDLILSFLIRVEQEQLRWLIDRISRAPSDLSFDAELVCRLSPAFPLIQVPLSRCR